MSQESREKMRQAKLGKTHGPLSPEHAAKLRQGLLKRWARFRAAKLLAAA
jgi:hypothetical protein